MRGLGTSAPSKVTVVLMSLYQKPFHAQQAVNGTKAASSDRATSLPQSTDGTERDRRAVFPTITR